MHAPTLAQWVGDVDGFAADHWQKRPGVFRPDSPRVPRSPFTLEDVDAALAGGLLRAPYFEMTHAGRPEFAPAAYGSARTVNHAAYDGYADGAKIGALLAQGATLLLRCVDQWHAPTGDVLAALADELGRRVEAFFFVTPAGNQGLPLHRDDADVLVVQVAGRKTWFVHEGPTRDGWRPDRVPEGENPAEILRVTLEPGDVLYVPRAFAHRAVGEAGLSAHLSLTVREVAIRDLYRGLQQVLIEGMDLPQRPLDEAALLGAAESMLSHFRDRLAELSPDRLLADARRAQRGHVPLPRSDLSLAALADTWSGGAGPPSS